MSVRFVARLLLTIWAVLVFRLTLGPKLAIAGVEPDLVAAVVFYLTLRRGVVVGVVSGFILGLLVDVERPQAVGVSSLAWCTMSFLTARISRAVESTDPIVASTVLLLGVLAAETIRSIIVAGADPGRFLLIWIRWALPTALYTATATPILVAAAHAVSGESRWFGGRS